MGVGNRDEKPLRVLRILVVSLPLILKIALVYLKYKRTTKKRNKSFKKTLNAEGVEDRVAEKLTEGLPVISFREILSNSKSKFDL